jgi:hypothetical protein
MPSLNYDSILCLISNHFTCYDLFFISGENNGEWRVTWRRNTTNLQIDPVDGDTIDSIILLVLHVLSLEIQSEKITVLVFCYEKYTEILRIEVTAWFLFNNQPDALIIQIYSVTKL